MINNILKPYIQPTFLICVITLAAAGASKKAVIEISGAKLRKEPIYLKKPLDLMDKALLAPYQIVNESKIDNKDVLEELGTEEYIQWIIEDTEAPKFSPTRYCSLFITYYTGNPDKVPHVPEECYTGAGNQQRSNNVITLNINRTQETVNATENENTVKSEPFDVRHLIFARKGSSIWDTNSIYSVMYFFSVNGKYASGRGETRKIMGSNLLGRYSYFSKVEWKFMGEASGNRMSSDKNETIKASEKLLSVLLPILEKEHWPDWEKAKNE